MDMLRATGIGTGRARISTAGFAVVVVAALAGCAAVGGRLFDLNGALQRRASGLVEKRVRAGQLEIAYAEGGQGVPLVMVHGFSADKSNWYPWARHFTGDHRVIALDLPPFGESDSPPPPSCTVEGHVQNLHAFVTALGLERFHLVGNSMGGHTAALYTGRHPERVLTLALLDAAGVDMSTDSDAVKLLKGGTNGFAIRNQADAERFFDLLFVDRPRIPAPVMTWFTQKEVARADNIARWFDEYLAHFVKLEPLLPSIRQPTLVLWGDTDRVLDVSCADAFRRGLPNVTVVVMERCGHVPMIERPEETAAHYRSFLTAHGAR